MTNKWDDEKIQKLLRELPDIQDNRSKEDVLSRLKQDNRIQEIDLEKIYRKTKQLYASLCCCRSPPGFDLVASFYA